MTRDIINRQPAEPTGAESLSSAREEPENFAFVLNVSRLIDAEAYTVAPGHTLRRATPDEQEIIRKTLSQMPAATPLWHQLGGLTRLWELPMAVSAAGAAAARRVALLRH